jgi:hypothetical protein
MNKKNIKKSLDWKLKDWINSIDDQSVISAIMNGAIVTGGAFVQMLNSEEPHDYDIYFKTKKDLLTVVNYYITRWSRTHDGHVIKVVDSKDRVLIRVQSTGVVEEPVEVPSEDPRATIEPYIEEETPKKEKYRPVFISTNAITLSDKIQIVVRFFGSVDEIHKNYDYVHTTCSYDFSKGIVELPSRALEAIINKELFYQGSRYPLASIIRSRKFIQRGWTINAGQYLKMALQLNDMDLKDPEVLEDQLVGVDSYYFSQFIESLRIKKEEDPNFSIDTTYLIEVINRIF